MDRGAVTEPRPTNVSRSIEARDPRSAAGNSRDNDSLRASARRAFIISPMLGKGDH